MKVVDVCKNYFNGFQEVSDFRKNDSTKNILAALKVLSYFTVLIPVGFAIAYGAASLYGRVSKKQDLSHHDQSIHDKAKTTILKKDNITDSTPIDVAPFNISELQEKAKVFVGEREYSDDILAYIQNVLANPSFQQNPSFFMNKWKEERGFTEEFRIAEDSARMFFEQELHL
jgi:hypothetical protein